MVGTHLATLRERNRDIHWTVLRQPVGHLHVTEAVVLHHEHGSGRNRKRHYWELDRRVREGQARIDPEALSGARSWLVVYRGGEGSGGQG